jgi:hypothetical protein
MPPHIADTQRVAFVAQDWIAMQPRLENSKGRHVSAYWFWRLGA